MSGNVADAEADMVVVLLKRKPSHDWEFITYAVTKEVGWRSAAMLQQQEQLILDNPKAKAIVVKRPAYDRGTLNRLRCPDGFDTGLDPDSEVTSHRRKVDAEERRNPPVQVAVQTVRRRRSRGDGDLDL